jgi:hypothetical protein
MVPFWIFDGPSKIERRLPMLPLLEFLKRHTPEGNDPVAASERHIDLKPPAAS